MRVSKQSSSRVIFFCGKLCEPVTRITAKKKNTRLDNFFCTGVYRRKKLHDLPKKITRCDDFFLHTFTAEIKNYTTLQQITYYTESACFQAMCPPVGHFCFFPTLGVGDPQECRGDIALPPSSRPPRLQG